MAQKFTGFFLFILISFGCGTLSVTSNPEGAEISIMNSKKGSKPLGKSPLKIAASDFSDFISQGPAIITIRKDGYQSQNFIIPDYAGADIQIDVSLEKEITINYEQTNTLVGKVLEAERLIMHKQLDKALEIARDIKSSNMNITAAYEIEGAIYLLQGKVKDSHYAWSKCLEIDPENANAKRMLGILQEKLGRGQEEKSRAASK